MIHIPAPENKRLVWYLAMEEYLGQNIQTYPQGVFFTWIVSPTVIFGRHQVMAQEVNIDYCNKHNISTYRRKSGGGCVYADRGNLMLSYIVPSTHSEHVFQTYLDQMTDILSKLGLSAVKSEHNDILVGQHKVSGNACYALHSGTIVHGTMLYDVNFSTLRQAITPPAEKLHKHGVQSVRQRVLNLKPLLTDHTDISTINQLAHYITTHLCQETILLSPAEYASIEQIEQTYLQPSFIFDK